MNSSIHAPTHEHRARDLIITCSRPQAVLVPHENIARARAHCTRTLHKALVGAHCTEAHTHTHDHIYLHRHRKERRLIHTRRTQRSSSSRTHARHTKTYSHLTAVRVGFTCAMQGPYTPISTRTNSADVPRHIPNGVGRPVTVQHDHARACAVSDQLSDLCRHERRFWPVPVQASSGGSTGSVKGPGPSNRPREGRPAPSPQRGMNCSRKRCMGAVDTVDIDPGNNGLGSEEKYHSSTIQW